MELKRGFRDKLEKYVDLADVVEIDMTTTGSAVYDYSCFGLDSNEKLSDDRYMIFYNQTESPNRELSYSALDEHSARFLLRLNKLPQTINKLAFTVSIDGDGTMGKISTHEIKIKQRGQTVAVLSLNGSDFTQEKAIISLEIYRKQVWRLAAVASGFNGGLGDLLRNYGGEEESSKETEPIPTPPRSESRSPENSRASSPNGNVPSSPVVSRPTSSVEADMAQAVRSFQNYVSRNGLQGCIAKVALVVEMSSQMAPLYEDGTIQEIVNKIIPLALQFDDNGKLEFWYYAGWAKKMSPLTKNNYTQAVPQDWGSLMWSMGKDTHSEALVISSVMTEYINTDLPVYVIFITGGNIPIQYEASVEQMLRGASLRPIYWQFIGTNGCNYELLDRLNNLTDRPVNNTNFFTVGNFKQVSNEALYDLMLKEFSSWLREAKANGIVR